MWGNGESTQRIREMKARKKSPAEALALDEDLELMTHFDEQCVKLPLCRMRYPGLFQLLKCTVEAQSLEKAGLGGKTAVLKPTQTAPVVEGGKIYVAGDVLLPDELIRRMVHLVLMITGKRAFPVVVQDSCGITIID